MQSIKTISVTGGNGFIGLQIIKTFLERNYKVVATVRDAQNKEKIQDLINLPKSENLNIVSANFSDPSSFENAFKDVDAVIHNASPLNPDVKDRDSYVQPALTGIDSVFNAVLKNQSTIRNIIQISSMAAVCGEPGSKPDDYMYSNRDWSDPENQDSRNVYYALSKTLGEKRVWEYKENLNKNNIKLATICPTLVLGPILSQNRQSNSTKGYLGYLNGEKTEIPNLSKSLVDVRDVAEMCFQAVLKNSQGRYIAVEKGYTVEQIVNIMRKNVNEEIGKKIPTNLAEGKKAVPSLFDLNDSIDLLGRDFISGEIMIKDMVESWRQHKYI